MADTDTSPWMTKREAADRLRVDTRTIDRYAEAGKLTRHRIGGLQSIRFSRDEVDALVIPEN